MLVEMRQLGDLWTKQGESKYHQSDALVGSAALTQLQAANDRMPKAFQIPRPTYASAAKMSQFLRRHPTSFTSGGRPPLLSLLTSEDKTGILEESVLDVLNTCLANSFTTDLALLKYLPREVLSALGNSEEDMSVEPASCNEAISVELQKRIDAILFFASDEAQRPSTNGENDLLTGLRDKFEAIRGWAEQVGDRPELTVDHGHPASNLASLLRYCYPSPEVVTNEKPGTAAQIISTAWLASKVHTYLESATNEHPDT
jgi:hypothetical protein